MRFSNSLFYYVSVVYTTNEISPEIQSGTISGKFTGNTTQNRQRQKKTGTYLPATPVEAYFCLNHPSKLTFAWISKYVPVFFCRCLFWLVNLPEFVPDWISVEISFVVNLPCTLIYLKCVCVLSQRGSFIPHACLEFLPTLKKYFSIGLRRKFTPGVCFID